MIPCNLLTSSFSLAPQWALLVNSNPNPTSTAFPFTLPSLVNARRLLCRCRRRDSSLDPNAESVRGGRFRFRDESGGGEVGGDFGQGQRRWWSDGDPDDDFSEEFDSIDEDEDDDEQLWDKIWIFKVQKHSSWRWRYLWGNRRFPLQLASCGAAGRKSQGLVLGPGGSHFPPPQLVSESSSRMKAVVRTREGQFISHGLPRRTAAGRIRSGPVLEDGMNWMSRGDESDGGLLEPGARRNLLR